MKLTNVLLMKLCVDKSMGILHIAGASGNLYYLPGKQFGNIKSLKTV